ncbi:MAG: RNA polymerase sigma factor [Kiritimatiellae bacterium]|nr:RNA polymerase sigma factor [Kiritimatiellia bacterium]
MDGSEHSVAELFEGQYSRMLGIARGLLGSEQDAEDAVQEAMLSLLRAPHLLAGVERIGSWLYTVVRRRCVDLIRREARRREAEADLDDLFAGATPSELMAQDEFCAAVARSVERLAKDERRAFVENALNGKPFREISAESGIPMGTLMARKKRAVDRIRMELRREGYLR